MIDIFIRLNIMKYVQCGKNSKSVNIPVNLIISDKSMAIVIFARNLRTSALVLYYVGYGKAGRQAGSRKGHMYREIERDTHVCI